MPSPMPSPLISGVMRGISFVSRDKGARSRDAGWYMLKGLEVGYLEFDLRRHLAVLDQASRHALLRQAKYAARGHVGR